MRKCDRCNKSFGTMAYGGHRRWCGKPQKSTAGSNSPASPLGSNSPARARAPSMTGRIPCPNASKNGCTRRFNNTNQLPGHLSWCGKTRGKGTDERKYRDESTKPKRQYRRRGMVVDPNHNPFMEFSVVQLQKAKEQLGEAIKAAKTL